MYEMTSSLSLSRQVPLPITLWDLLFMSYAPEKQTNKQTNRWTRMSYPRRRCHVGTSIVTFSECLMHSDVSFWFLLICCNKNAV